MLYINKATPPVESKILYVVKIRLYFAEIGERGIESRILSRKIRKYQENKIEDVYEYNMNI